MLELGLSRIGKLVTASKLPWRAIHVAGTNGKGSVCAYTSSMLGAARVSHGQFTSPHLIDRWDCISINGKPIKYESFSAMERNVREKSRSQVIEATEFEELTAIAFKAFTNASVKVGVVEVGLGGRFDATNILENPFSTVITKIGHDHESLLGSTVEEIAFQKAGILKPGVPCFVDGSNLPSVRSVIADYAEEIGSGPVRFIDPSHSIYDDEIWRVLPRASFAEHQQMNVTLAFEATKAVLGQNRITFTPDLLASSVRRCSWPGRLQTISVGNVTSRKEDVLLDGAHNSQAAAALGSFVDGNLRSESKPVTWLIAMTQGKRIEEVLRNMMRRGDHLVTVAFGPVDGMPWVRPVHATDLLERAKAIIDVKTAKAGSDVSSALQIAVDTAQGGPLVIGGSLYLASDVLRLLRNATGADP